MYMETYTDQRVGRKLVAKSYMGCKGSLLGGGALTA